MFGEIAPRANVGFKPLIENSNTASATASCTSVGSIVSGAGAIAVGVGSVVIGNKAFTPALGGIAIGQNASTNNVAGTLAIGYNAYANNGSVSIGPNSNCNVGNGVAIGSTALNWAANGVSVGYNANASSNSGSISLGGGSAASGPDSICLGINAAASGTRGINIGGQTSTNAFNGAISIGGYCKAEFIGEITFSTGDFAAQGDAKISQFPLWMTTTDATVTELKTGAGSAATVPAGVIILSNNSMYIFDVDIIARKSTTGTDYSAWNLKFAINREANAASTALVGTVVKTLIGQTSGASTWDVNATADTTNGRPNISVTGQSSTTIRWVANARMTKSAG